jgi:hypothetical protein
MRPGIGAMRADALLRLKWSLAASPVLLLLASAASGAEPVTAANWRRHPAIVEIEAIYREVRQAEAAGCLRRKVRTFSYCRSYEDTARTIYLDRHGVARSYRRTGGSDDSAVQAAYYYDRRGALRLLVADVAAVDGTTYQYRIFLSKSGVRLWEERHRLKGPGYPFPGESLDEWLVRDPKQAFAASSLCDEW